MIQTEKSLDIKIYPPDVQGVGEFDGGRITETKPIAFPGEGPNVPNTGPLFYWAWATAEGYGKIGLHPHQAFEIMSYALEGEIGHYDTLGNRSRVKAGGAQVMQTGSGVSHEEETVGDRTEFFQIWFDPNLKETINQAPTYREISPEEFPTESRDGVTIKSVIGEAGPITIKAEAVMKEITISPSHQFTWNIKKNYSLAIVTIDGDGLILDDANGRKDSIQKKDFVVVHAKEDSRVSFQANLEGKLKLVLIQIPAKVDYPLYSER
jgi:redox-sensitive bicupin YhaK (pirin superfamily)